MDWQKLMYTDANPYLLLPNNKQYYKHSKKTFFKRTLGLLTCYSYERTVGCRNSMLVMLWGQYGSLGPQDQERVAQRPLATDDLSRQEDGQLLSPARCTVVRLCSQRSEPYGWYYDHTVLQLELWMMDDESSAWEVFLPACFNSQWLQAPNIAWAFTSFLEMWWLTLLLFFFSSPSMKRYEVSGCWEVWHTAGCWFHSSVTYCRLTAISFSLNKNGLEPFQPFENLKPLMLSVVFFGGVDDHRLLFHLHLTPSGCGVLFFHHKRRFIALDNESRCNKEQSNNIPNGCHN